MTAEKHGLALIITHATIKLSWDEGTFRITVQDATLKVLKWEAMFKIRKILYLGVMGIIWQPFEATLDPAREAQASSRPFPQRTKVLVCNETRKLLARWDDAQNSCKLALEVRTYSQDIT